MDSKRDRYGLLSGLTIAAAGAGAGASWSIGLWLTMTGMMLIALWALVLNLLMMRRPPPAPPAQSNRTAGETTIERSLLNASPTPLLLVDGTVVRALNRAARRLFHADDRVLPAPPPLLHRDSSHLNHAGRTWRIDRVGLGAQVVAALIDVESEVQTAEARASAEMIQVLGHEVLNGLMPIVSLAEAGVTAAAAKDVDPALLPEILNTLARRAESLQRFTEAYRALARLPPPVRKSTSMASLLDDLGRLLSSRWPDVKLSIEVRDGVTADVDPDQVSQALWALLQNAIQAANDNTAEAAAVHVRAWNGEAALEVDITDSGSGVAPADATSIFRPFMTTKPTGTGIGLSLARQIVQAHGGTLVLLPSPPTTFRMRLPLTNPGQNVGRAERDPDEHPPAPHDLPAGSHRRS